MKIGIYAGSFDPFHIGHKNIVDKALNIFDHVIIAFGSNVDKNSMSPINRKSNLMIHHSSFLNNEHLSVGSYDGLLTDYILRIEDNYGEFPTLIRGIRNSTDYAYEINMLRVLQDINSRIEVVLIPCDKKYEHISSSMIRNLNKFNIKEVEKYVKF